MNARRAAALALLALSACPTEVKQQLPPQDVVLAAFVTDPADAAYALGTPGPKLPQPNDLGLQAAPGLSAGAQKELLQVFSAAGGFPSDQEVTITIPVRALTFTAGAYAPAPAPDLDLATVGAAAVVLKLDGAVVDVPIEVGGYSRSADGMVGTLTLRKAAVGGSRRWAPGRYVAALRGGASGVRTTAGLPLSAEQPVRLVAANRDLTLPENRPPVELTPEQIQDLVMRRAIYANPLPWCHMLSGPAPGWNPVTSTQAGAACGAPPIAPQQAAFAAVSSRFPLAELASIQTFEVAPAATVVLVDSGSGQAPLPIDLLRTGPAAASGARTIAFNAAFGPAAQGLTTLDGFSTTAMILAPTSRPVDVASITPANVFLFKLDPGGGAPTRLRDVAEAASILIGGGSATPSFLLEPPPITAACTTASGSSLCASALGLQPAVGVPVGGPIGTFYLPPLDESSSYAVVVTRGVTGAAGEALARSTVAKLLLEVSGDLVVGGRSALAGVDDATAAALQAMRDELQPVLGALPFGRVRADVAAAWTFRTQSITPMALQAVAIPYDPAGPAAVQASTPLTPAEVSAQYGIAEAAFQLPSPLPANPIAGFAEVQLNTTSLLLASQNQGAFDPAHPAPELVTALVAIPDPALVPASPACPPGAPAFTAAKCAPLVLFHHGITRSRADLLPIAAMLAAQGFVAVAIDGDKHGDRAWCTSDAQCCPAALCGTASTCALKGNLRTPVDAQDIGVCESAPGVRGRPLAYRVDCAEPLLAGGAPNPACLSPKGVAFTSASFLVSLNFFRTRDTLRQDLIDQSAVVAALAPPGKSGDAFAAALETDHGLAVDYTRVYWLSQSLGSMQGVLSAAANPRISRAVFNVGGATMVDVFANPESGFHAELLSIIAPVAENTPEYLQLLQVAKWILDPADPANFARHVETAKLPSPLGTAFPTPASRAILTQTALCDATVPNAQNTLLSGLLGLQVPAPGAAGTGRAQWYVNTADASLACPGSAGATSHGFLLDPTGSPSLTGKGQAAAASFLSAPADLLVTVRP